MQITSAIPFWLTAFGNRQGRKKKGTYELTWVFGIISLPVFPHSILLLMLINGNENAADGKQKGHAQAGKEDKHHHIAVHVVD